MWNELERSDADADGEGIDSAVAQAFFSATSRLRALATSEASKQLGSLLGGSGGGKEEKVSKEKGDKDGGKGKDGKGGGAGGPSALPSPPPAEPPAAAAAAAAASSAAKASPRSVAHKTKVPLVKGAGQSGGKAKESAKAPSPRSKKGSASEATAAPTPKSKASSEPQSSLPSSTPAPSAEKASEAGSTAASTPKVKVVTRRSAKKATTPASSTKPTPRKLVSTQPVEKSAVAATPAKEAPKNISKTSADHGSSQEAQKEAELKELRKEKKKAEQDRKSTLEKLSQVQAELDQLTEKNIAMTRAQDNAQREHLAETQKLANMLRGQEEKSSAEIKKLKAKVDDTERANSESTKEKQEMRDHVDLLTEQCEELQRSLSTIEQDQQKAREDESMEVQQKLEALQAEADRWRQECKAAREEAETAREEVEHSRMLQQPRSGSSTSSEWELLQAENEKLRRQVEKILLSREDTPSLSCSTEDLRRQPSSQSLEALTLAGVKAPLSSVAVSELNTVTVDASQASDDSVVENLATAEKRVQESALELQKKEHEMEELRKHLQNAQEGREQLANEIQELKAKAEATEAQEQTEANDELSRAVAQLEEEKARFGELEIKMKTAQGEMQSQLEAEKAQREKAEAHLTSVQAELEGKIESESAKRAEAEAQQTELNSQLEQLKASIESQQTEADSSIHSLNEQASQTAKKLDDLEAKLSKALAEKGELQKEAKKLKRSNQAVEKRAEELQGANEELEDLRVGLEDELEKLRDELVVRQRATRAAKKKLESQEPVVLELNQQIENLNNEKKSLEEQKQADLDEKDKIIETLRERVVAAESVAAKDSQTAKDELKGSRDELKEAQKLTQQEKTKVKELTEKQESFKSKIRALEAENTGLLDEKKAAMEELTQRIAQGQADLASAREAEQVAQGRATSLEEEIRAYKLRAGLLLRKKEEELVQAIGSDEDNAQLVASVKELTDRVEALTTERDYLQERLREESERIRSVDDIVSMQEKKILAVEERAKEAERTKEEEVSTLRISVADLESQLADSVEETRRLSQTLNEAEQMKEQASGLDGGEDGPKARIDTESRGIGDQETELKEALEEARREHVEAKRELKDLRDTADKLLLAKDTEVARLLAENATLKKSQEIAGSSSEAAQHATAGPLPTVTTPSSASMPLSTSKSEGSWKISRVRLIMMFYVGLLHLFMAFLLFSSNSATSSSSSYPAPDSSLGAATSSASRQKFIVLSSLLFGHDGDEANS